MSAIVVCCSKGGLAIIRALGERGIDVAGLCFRKNEVGAASRFVRERRYCPDPGEHEEAFVGALMSFPSKWNGSVLYPADDGSLVAISRHALRLRERYRPICEPWSTVSLLIEKHRTYEIARAHGIPCPEVELVESVDGAYRFARRVGYPFLLKPCVGHLFFKRYRVKMLMVHTEAQLRSHLATVMDYGGAFMLCEYIPGGDECGANYNSFALGGAPAAEFTGIKVRNKPRLIGFPTVVRSVVLPEVCELGRRMLRALELNDFSCMEFKRDVRDGRFKLMEVNARHNYSGALATRCGVNFPLFSYRHARGELLPPASPQREGVYWIDEERDAKDVLAALWRRRGTRSALAPYRGPKVFAVSRMSDPGPSLAMVRSSLSHLATRSSRRARHEHAQVFLKS